MGPQFPGLTLALRENLLPVLAGEGHYALRDVKTVEVTKEFVGLGEKVTHCQTEEYRVDCLSSKYREKVLSQCQC